MKRTKSSPFKVSTILTADWHLREDTPECRTDDFWTAQGNKLVEIAGLAEHYKCPILNAGDLFNHWKASPLLLSLFINNFHNHQHFFVYGNHDLPQHNLMLSEKSGIEPLRCDDSLQILSECHWEQEPTEKANILFPQSDIPGSVRKVLVWHVMTYKDEQPWPDCTDLPAIEILKKYIQFDLIVTGHNHKPFVEEYEGRLLINPGSITRQAADELHEPCVYLWDADQNKIKKHVLKHEKDVISREHIDRKKEKEARYQAFVENLKKEGKPKVSFVDNLERHFQANKTSKSIKQYIYEKLEE